MTSRVRRPIVAALILCAVPTLFGQRPRPQPSSIDGPEHAGEVVTCDVPESEHKRNVGSRIDGAGMCVMTSVEVAAMWANLEQLRGLRDHCAKESGGGYPTKVDRQVAAFAKQHNIEPPPYLQYEGGRPEEILDLIDKTGRVACVTYGTSPRYNNATIAHMVNAVRCRNGFAVVLDNNFPGAKQYEWMSREEFVRRVKHPDGRAWVFCWLAPPPPPVPK